VRRERNADEASVRRHRPAIERESQSRVPTPFLSAEGNTFRTHHRKSERPGIKASHDV